MDEPDPAQLRHRLEQAEDALRRVQEVYDHGPDPVLEVDRAGVITALNHTASRSLGDGLVGRALDVVFTGGARAYGPDGQDREVRLHDGRTMLLRSVPRPDGAPGAIVALRDVTERTAMREEVESGRRTAAVARIAGGIAHEINNPLTVLQLRTDLLLEEAPTADSLRQQLPVLRESIHRIARTVRTLQRIGRPTAATSEWVSVADLVLAAVEANGNGRVAVDPPALVGVRGDRAALALAVEQIVSFAVDSGGGTARVVVHGERVRIEVHVDQATWTEGPIPDPGTSPDPPDSRFPGIGLTVTAAIARDHGGELRTGRGAVSGAIVRLELPLATALGSTPAPPRSRVLVVDDEPLIAQVLVDWGRRVGHDIEVVRTAETAIAVLERDERFDVILSDDRLPGTSGRDLLGWIRKARPMLTERFVLMSGAPVDLPGVRFLPKPFTRRQLAELMNTVLQGR